MASPIEKENLVILDREDPLKSDDLIEKIHKVINDLDQTGRLIVQAGEKSTPSLIQLYQVGEQTILVQTKKAYVATMGTISEKKRLTRFVVVGMRLARNVAEAPPETLRHLENATGRQEMDLKDITNLARTWAVTLGVHPYEFGLIPKVTGQVFIPRGISLVPEVVENIFTRLESKGYITKKVTIQSPSSSLATSMSGELMQKLASMRSS